MEARGGCWRARVAGLCKLSPPDACCAPQVKTSPFDPRFPTTNQAKNCYTRYNEFHKCAAAAAARAPRKHSRQSFRPAGAPRPLTRRARARHARRCAKEKDAEDPACQKFASFYRSICPTEWVRVPRCAARAAALPRRCCAAAAALLRVCHAGMQRAGGAGEQLRSAVRENERAPLLLALRWAWRACRCR